MTVPPEHPVEAPGLLAALLGYATPDLYRTNIFRILNLPVTATIEDVEARESKLQLMSRVSATRPARQAACLPLDPPPETPAIHQAAQRFLREPDTRLRDVFFWFWPAEARSDTDDALELLSTGNPHGAGRRWTAMARDPAVRPVARHNLAVLHHALALDLESAGAAAPLPRKLASQRDHDWTEAYRNWHAVAVDESFWEAAALRLAAIRNSPVPPQVLARLRRELPAAILGIGAHLTVQAAQAGRADDLRRHLAALRHSGFPPPLVSAALEGRMAPHIARIKALAGALAAQSQALPQSAHDLATAFIAQVRPLLALAETILGEQHPWCQTARDAVATVLRQCVWDLINAAQRWPEGLALIGVAGEIVADASLQAQLNKDAEAIQQHLNEQANRAAADLVQQANQAAEQRDFGRTQRLLREALALCTDPYEKSLIAGRLDLARSAGAPGPPVPAKKIKGPSRPFLVAVVIVLAMGLAFLVVEVLLQSSAANRPAPSGNGPAVTGQQPGVASPASPSPAPGPDAQLLAQIDAGKAQAAKLETEIQKMDDQLRQWSAQIASDDAAIGQFADQAARHAPVDQAAWDQTIKHHNDLVTQFNALAGEHRAKAAEYGDLITSINEMVARYNRGQQ